MKIIYVQTNTAAKGGGYSRRASYARIYKYDLVGINRAKSG